MCGKFALKTAEMCQNVNRKYEREEQEDDSHMHCEVKAEFIYFQVTPCSPDRVP